MEKSNTKKTAIAPVDPGRKTEIYLSCPSRRIPKKIEQNGKKKEHKKTAIAPVDLGRKTEICPSCQKKLSKMGKTTPQKTGFCPSCP